MGRHRSRSGSRERSKTKKHKHRKHSSRSRSRDRHQKKSHRRSRTASVSSVSSVESVEDKKPVLDERLDKLREEKRRQRTVDKQRMKERETPEEKRARRIAKKTLKEEHRRAAALSALPETIPYTDLNNPFNDNNLTATFVWGKKLEVEGKSSLNKKEIERLNRERIHKNVHEMEELKRNRDARQAAKDDIEMIQRDQERAKNSDWRRLEDTFHMQQAKLRTRLRIKEGRGKAIDFLARYCAVADPNDGGKDYEDFELVEPLTYIDPKKCSVDDYEDLLEDIKVFRVIDGRKYTEFWDDIETMVKAETKKKNDARRRDAGETVHSSVQDDVTKIFKGKSYAELENLERQMVAKIKNAGRGVDVAYWETVLECLRPHMAKTRLKEKHSEVVRLQVRRMKEEQKRKTEEYEREHAKKLPPAVKEIKSEEGDEPGTSGFKAPAPVKPKDEETKMERLSLDAEKKLTEEQQIQMINDARPLPFTPQELEALEEDEREQKWSGLDEKQLRRFAVQLYREGNYEPSYSDERQAMPGIEILDEEEDAKKLKATRDTNRKGAGGAGGALSAREAELLEIAQRGMSNDESTFAVEESLGEQKLLWADKYRPRKPRYFNRVHTGFDWNKYNQTHYDLDNPPPKIVQGYRFNIFYPDLLDATKTPSFKLMECDDPDFAVLRFTAGPPYEDIAFKIVNREWEVNHKHGYKCQFQNGVFQLWFFFKRYRYRR